MAAEHQGDHCGESQARMDQNGREVPLSSPDEWCLLPTSLFNIHGEWGQWDITHHQGDWRKLEENMEEDEEIKMRRYQCCKKQIGDI